MPLPTKSLKPVEFWHEGILYKYESSKAAARAWEKNPHTVRRRQANGMSVELSYVTPADPKRQRACKGGGYWADPQADMIDMWKRFLGAGI